MFWSVLPSDQCVVTEYGRLGLMPTKVVTSTGSAFTKETTVTFSVTSRLLRSGMVPVNS